VLLPHWAYAKQQTAMHKHRNAMCVAAPLAAHLGFDAVFF
jgi:hypothetical protein